MRLANIFELGIKELRGLVRDPALMLLIVYAFTLNIYTAATAEPETLNKAAVAIVDEDRSQVSARIESALYPPYFLPPKMIASTEIDPRMNAGLDTFVLDIPPEFQRDLLAGRSPQIQLNIDATQMTQAFSGGRYIQEIVTGEVTDFLNRGEAEDRATVSLSLRARFNPELDKGWFGAINEVISAVTMLSIILTGAALIREREHGHAGNTRRDHAKQDLVDGSRRAPGDRLFPLCRRGSRSRCPAAGIDVPLSGRSDPATGRRHLHGDFPGDSGRFDAAVRALADAGSIAAADPVRRYDPA
jgi:hypothetical protein